MMAAYQAVLTYIEAVRLLLAIASPSLLELIGRFERFVWFDCDFPPAALSIFPQTQVKQIQSHFQQCRAMTVGSVREKGRRSIPGSP